MSKHNLNVLEFPAINAQKSILTNNNASGSALLTIVNVNNTDSGVIATKPLAKQSHSNQYNIFGRGECLTGLLVTLALHLFWIFSASTAETQEPIKPSKPIMVQWINAPKTHTEPLQPSQPQPQKKTAKPVTKAKPKQPKVAAKPSKPLIAASHKAAEGAFNPPAMTTQPEPQAIVPSQAAPMATAVAKSGAAEQTPITLPHLNAGYLDNPAPNYPLISRELGEQGRVLVRAMVTIDGHVGQVALRKSSGFSRLDQAALESVKQWRFVPAQRGGQQVQAWVVVPVTFSIEG